MRQFADSRPLHIGQVHGTRPLRLFAMLSNPFALIPLPLTDQSNRLFGGDLTRSEVLPFSKPRQL